MPNWVYNTIKGKKEDLEKLVVKGDFSFKTIIGMPKLLFLMNKSRKDFQRIDEGLFLKELSKDEKRKTRIKEELRADFNSSFKNIRNDIKKQLLKNNLEIIDWYAWNSHNWGCKWDASDVSITESNGELTIEFKTPWGTPEPVLEALTERGFNFHYEWIEEQGPDSLGYFTILNGEKIDEYRPVSWSKEAYELMFEWWGNADEYKWNEKEESYVWIDEDEESEAE